MRFFYKLNFKIDSDRMRPSQKKGEYIMTYDGLKDTIVNSEPEEWLYDDEKGLFVFKNDVLISIVQKKLITKKMGFS